MAKHPLFANSTPQEQDAATEVGGWLERMAGMQQCSLLEPLARLAPLHLVLGLVPSPLAVGCVCVCNVQHKGPQ